MRPSGSPGAVGARGRDQAAQATGQVSDHPRYQRMDEVLFYLAFAYQDGRDMTNARVKYRLIARGQGCDHVIEYRHEASCDESVGCKKIRHLRYSQSAKRCGKNSLHAGADRRRCVRA